MGSHPVRARHLALFALLLFAALATSGEPKRIKATYSCKNETVYISADTVHFPHGVEHDAVYLCAGYTLSFQARSNDVQSFDVSFDVGQYPFTDTAHDFTDSTPSSAMPNVGDLTVYKYLIQWTDKQNKNHSFDPHVVSGGGLVPYNVPPK